MSVVVTAIKEVWGLFVDDGALALGLLVWCGLAGLAFRLLPLPGEVLAPLLCLGCVAILLGTVATAAQRARRG